MATIVHGYQLIARRVITLRFSIFWALFDSTRIHPYFRFLGDWQTIGPVSLIFPIVLYPFLFLFIYLSASTYPSRQRVTRLYCYVYMIYLERDLFFLSHSVLLHFLWSVNLVVFERRFFLDVSNISPLWLHIQFNNMHLAINTNLRMVSGCF